MGDVVDLFNKDNTVVEGIVTEQPLREHFEHFLSTLDSSLDSYQTLSAYEKYNLYETLVSFTHTSLESFLRLKGE